MKKFAFLAFTMIAGLAAVGCGSSACDDYKTKISDCCGKISDATAKAACQAQVDAIDTSSADSAACEAAAAAYTCPIQ